MVRVSDCPAANTVELIAGIVVVPPPVTFKKMIPPMSVEATVGDVVTVRWGTVVPSVPLVIASVGASAAHPMTVVAELSIRHGAVAPTTVVVPGVIDVAAPPLATNVVPLNDNPDPNVIAEGAAALPVGLPCRLLAAKLACLVRVTAPAAIVFATAPAEVVTSPVNAGICAAANVPLFTSDAAIDLLVNV